MMKKLALLISLLLASAPIAARAESPDEWVRLGKRVHGGFGTYIALGIRVGLDAMSRLKAEPRDLVVTYQDGPTAPCPCVVDGIMLATVATPGQNSLHVLPTKSSPAIFGIAVIQNKKTGQALRYMLPASAGLLLDTWNKGKTERDRYMTVINAPQARLFYVEALSQPRKQLQAPLNRQH